MADIKRRSKIIVASTATDNYGNLLVKTKQGGEVKISKKRDNLFDFFQEGAEIVLGWSEYMNKEYIAEATPSEQLIKADTPIEEEPPLVTEAKKMGAKTEKIYKSDPDKTSSIEKQVCLKAAIELCIADKIEPKEIIPNMREFFKEF